MIKKTKKNIHDSSSLWNFTKSPGWSEEEIKMLKLGLKTCGVGKWQDIKR